MFYSKENILNIDKKTNELFKALQEIRKEINRRIDFIETLELLSTILSYYIYEKQYDFKIQIDEIDEKRKALEEMDLTDAELIEKVDELNAELAQIEQLQDQKLIFLNHRKAKTTEIIEELMAELDFYFEQFQINFQNYSQRVAPASETCLLTDNFSIILDDYENYISSMEKMQINCWKRSTIDLKFASTLKQYGLKMTSSGTLLTLSDKRITYEDAHNRGYFNRLYQLFNELAPPIKAEPKLPKIKSLSKESSLYTQMSSEEVVYLKTSIGRPLTQALAELTMKQPRDPIHYLGHWLMKFRFNQDFDQIQSRELEELLGKRREIAYKRWRDFIETEARAAVLDILARVEQIIYEKEMKQFELDMLGAEDESEAN